MTAGHTLARTSPMALHGRLWNHGRKLLIIGIAGT